MSAAAHRSSAPGWLLDEVAAAGRENLDAAHVARCDEKEDAHAVEEVALLLELGLDRQSTVVDLGAGTGQLTLAVAPACGRDVAVDISPMMLARLRAKVVASELSNVDVVQAGFISYEHHGDCNRPARTRGHERTSRSTSGTSTRPSPGSWSQ